MKKITLAGGCFWGVEAYFKRIKGINKTQVGYLDESTSNPTYQEVCSGSGHAEAVYLEYDEDSIDLTTILKHLFRIIDPTQVNRQGNDIGIQYRSAIYTHEMEDMLVSKDFINKMQQHYAKQIQTVVLPATKFYPAEDYHQRYLDKNPNGYCHVDLNLASVDINTFKVTRH